MFETNIQAALFSLFHHDLTFQSRIFDFDTLRLHQLSKSPPKNSIENIADTLYSIITEHIEGLKDSDISMTLTGGMDSRVILACLLKAGIKPNCMAYGNPGASDIYFARKLAQGVGLDFHNAASAGPNSGWYYKWVIETLNQDNGNSHLHRAHRTAAIAEHAEKYSPKVLFTGHMGGEGLRGLSYNNYYTSPFFESVNEGNAKPIDVLKKNLGNYFLLTENINFDDLVDHVTGLPWMQHDRETNKLFFLYDLVGKIHHTQDIRLCKTYVPEVVPVYLQKSYLDILFSSSYHFLAKKKGVMGRLANPYVHCKLIESLYPELLDHPLSNGYKPMEYVKGLWHYVPIKLYRKFKHKKQFAPTFSYGQWYVDFVKEHAANISPDIWKIYDRKKYMNALEKQNHKTDEGYWHKFSNPIFFDLLAKHQKGMFN